MVVASTFASPRPILRSQMRSEAKSIRCYGINSLFTQGNHHANRTHKELLHTLENGRALSVEPFSKSKNRTAIFKVVLVDERGKQRNALFKPRQYGDHRGWGRNPMELVAYKMACALGLDLIPPVAYRYDFSLPHASGETVWSEGSVHYFVEDAHPLFCPNNPRASVPLEQWDLSLEGRFDWQDKELFRADARILDVLLHNLDRHAFNFMRGKHWVDGSYKPILIDHAACLHPNAMVNMTQPDALSPDPIKRVRQSTFNRLTHLSETQLRELCQPHVSEAEIQGIWERKQGILQYIDNNVQIVADPHTWQNQILPRLAKNFTQLWTRA